MEVRNFQLIYFTEWSEAGWVFIPNAIYSVFDGLIRRLEAKDVGCFIGRRYCGVFGYADDLALVSPTIHGLKEMIKICEDYACEFDIMFNPKSQS